MKPKRRMVMIIAMAAVQGDTNLEANRIFSLLSPSCILRI